MTAPLLATRDAIVAALEAAGLGITGDWDRSGEELVADALLASGVVRDPAALAADPKVLDAVEPVVDETGHALHRGVYDDSCRSCVRGRNLARSALLALAAALTEDPSA